MSAESAHVYVDKVVATTHQAATDVTATLGLNSVWIKQHVLVSIAIQY